MLFDQFEYSLLIGFILMPFVAYFLFFWLTREIHTRYIISPVKKHLLDLSTHHALRRRLFLKATKNREKKIPLELIPSQIQTNFTRGTYPVFIAYSPLVLDQHEHSMQCAYSAFNTVKSTRNLKSPYLYAKNIAIESPEFIQVNTLISERDINLYSRQICIKRFIAGKEITISSQSLEITELQAERYSINSSDNLYGNLARTQILLAQYDGDETDCLVRQKEKVVKKGTIITGPIVSYGNLKIEDSCILLAPVKVHGNLLCHSDIIFGDNLVVDGDARFKSACSVAGNTVIKGKLVVCGGFISGLNYPVSIIAHDIRIEGYMYGRGALSSVLKQGVSIHSCN